MTTRSDHPVFKRFSRQQLITRRRNIGFQTLVFEATATRPPRCKLCGRHFSATWKDFLCHVCGFWVCQPCSSVIEREREMHRVQYIRSCYDCLSMLNKWSDPELLTQLAQAPWVVASSKSQISLNLSDTLRTRREARQAVLVLLKHLGMAVDPTAAIVDEVTENEWVAATTQEVHTPQGIGLPHGDLQGRVDDVSPTAVYAQHVAQQCFDIVIPDLPIEACRFAEANGVRSYPVFYDAEEEVPQAPEILDDRARELCVDRYGLVRRGLNTIEMQLICDLAAKELEATTAFISVVHGDTQHSVASRPGCGCSTLQRSQTFCAFALTSQLPFLVRDASLDIRFRNFEVVRGAANVQFYFGFPILADDGTVIASLCVVDNKPHKYVTTMQYSIVKILAEIISLLWKEMLLVQTI